jgi:hypothetical protein
MPIRQDSLKFSTANYLHLIFTKYRASHLGNHVLKFIAVRHLNLIVCKYILMKIHVLSLKNIKRDRMLQ